MAAITAAMVKELRDKTGAGMMDCKKALAECDGDVEKALDWLRQKGLSKAAKRADRATSEGVIAACPAADGKTSTIVEVMTETDFVARGDQFQAFAKAVVEEIAEKAPESVEVFNERATELTAVTGEKTVVGRFFRESVAGEGVVGTYVHANGKLAVQKMPYLAPTLPYVKHLDITKRTKVGRLSASLGCKRGSIEKHPKTVLTFITRKHARVKSQKMAVTIKKLLRHIYPQIIIVF